MHPRSPDRVPIPIAGPLRGCGCRPLRRGSRTSTDTPSTSSFSTSRQTAGPPPAEACRTALADEFGDDQCSSRRPVRGRPSGPGCRRCAAGPIRRRWALRRTVGRTRPSVVRPWGRTAGGRGSIDSPGRWTGTGAGGVSTPEVVTSGGFGVPALLGIGGGSEGEHGTTAASFSQPEDEVRPDSGATHSRLKVQPDIDRARQIPIRSSFGHPRNDAAVPLGLVTGTPTPPLAATIFSSTLWMAPCAAALQQVAEHRRGVLDVWVCRQHVSTPSRPAHRGQAPGGSRLWWRLPDRRTHSLPVSAAAAASADDGARGKSLPRLGFGFMASPAEQTAVRSRSDAELIWPKSRDGARTESNAPRAGPGDHRSAVPESRRSRG